MRYKDTEVGRIPVEWEVRQVSEIGEVIAGGTPKTKVDEYWNGEIAWITPKDLSGYNNKYIYKGERSITKIGLENSSARLLPKGTVLFSSRAPIGYVAIAGKDMTTNQGFKSIVCNKSIANNIFIYYLMKYKKEEIENIAGGSTFKEVSGKVIKQFKVQIPPLAEQKAIADTLSSLDDKIELNNKINENLEKQAQAIFKHWFIDFEFPDENGNPYKSSGGEMVESELGMIPKGWEVKSLDKFVDRIDNRGKTPPYENEKTKFPLLDVATLRGDSRIVDYNKVSKYVSEETYNNWFRSGHPNNTDILISTVGSLAELKLFIGDIGCIAQNVVAMRTNSTSPYYLYEHLKFIRNDLISYDIGTVQPSIKITHIIKHPLILPKEDIISNFHDIAEKITNKVYLNNLSNQTLSQLRDTLLPKLMSGELRIPLD